MQREVMAAAIGLADRDTDERFRQLIGKLAQRPMLGRFQFAGQPLDRADAAGKVKGERDRKNQGEIALHKERTRDQHEGMIEEPVRTADPAAAGAVTTWEISSYGQCLPIFARRNATLRWS